MASTRNVTISSSDFHFAGRDVHVPHHVHNVAGSLDLGTTHHYPIFDDDNIHHILRSVPNLRRFHNDALGKATPGTGAWFFSWETFLMWLDGLLKIIWGFGLLGAGKTVFTSIVIDYLETRASRDLDSQTCVCYVYFRHNDCSLFTFRTVLEILVKQTLERHASCQVLAEEVYKRHIREKTQPGEPELLQLLREFTSRMSATFYVLEALDEAPVEVRFRLVQALASLNVKLFITSRPLHTLSAGFPDAHRFAITAQDMDLDAYLSNIVSCTPDLRGLLEEAEPACKEQIVSLTKQKCGGMFLYISLQVQALKECLTVHEVRETLRNCPGQIEQAYLHTWTRMVNQAPRRATYATDILLWALTALRPMTIDELRRAVAIAPDTGEFERSRLVGETLLIDLCLGLVYVEKESGIVLLVHDSARDILTGFIRKIYPYPQARLAEVCITHLTRCGFQSLELNHTEELIASLQKDPLLAYAHYAWASHSRDWVSHCHESQSTYDTTFVARLTAFVTGCHAFPVAIGDNGQLEALGPLHVAAYFNLPIGSAGSIVTQDPNIPTRKKGLTPLILACLEGSTRAAEELLGLPDILVNRSDNDGWTPLHWVSAHGCEGIFSKLLDHPQIQVNKRNQAGQTPLMLAAINGHAGIVKSFLALPHTNVNTVDISNQTAVMLAAANGREDIVELFLAHQGICASDVDENG